jgi:hypothetical protein
VHGAIFLVDLAQDKDPLRLSFNDRPNFLGVVMDRERLASLEDSVRYLVVIFLSFNQLNSRERFI